MRLIWLFLSTALLLVVSFSASAQSSIGVLNVKRILSESKAAQNIQDQVNEKREAFLADIAKKEEALRAQERAILDKAKDLPDEELLEQKRIFESALLKARKDSQAHRKKLDQALLVAMNELRLKIADVVDDISKERGYDMVLARKHVVWGGLSSDISDEALEALDKNVSSIPVRIEGE